MAKIHTFESPETAMAEAFILAGSSWMPTVIYVSAFIGITVSSFTGLMSQPRLLYAYAKDGLFFKVFKEIDPVKGVPVKGSWYTCVFLCIICFFLDLDQLSKVISLGNLLSYSFVNACVLALRFRRGENDQGDGYSNSN